MIQTPYHPLCRQSEPLLPDPVLHAISVLEILALGVEHSLAERIRSSDAVSRLLILGVILPVFQSLLRQSLIQIASRLP